MPERDWQSFTIAHENDIFLLGPTSWLCGKIVVDLVARPRPAFHCLQYGRAGEDLVSLVPSSREHYIIEKWQTLSE